MSVDKAMEHPHLSKIIKENPNLFSEERHYNFEQLILLLFVVYEHQKGEDSFWWPYLDLMPDV